MSAAVLVALLSTLGACAGGTPVAEPSGDVTTTAEPTPAFTPTTEPSPTSAPAPVRPAAMDSTDGKGAAAAAQYFLGLYPYMMRTGDTSEWDAMSWSECTFCNNSMADAAKMREGSATFEGGEVTTTVIEIYKRDDLVGGYPLDIELSLADAYGLDSSGRSWTLPAKTAPVRVEMIHGGTGWIVLNVLSVADAS